MTYGSKRTRRFRTIIADECRGIFRSSKSYAEEFSVSVPTIYGDRVDSYKHVKSSLSLQSDWSRFVEQFAATTRERIRLLERFIAIAKRELEKDSSSNTVDFI